MKKTVEIMIKEVMEDKGISYEALGRGVCSKSDLSRYLNGSRRIDQLLLSVLLQRLGISASKFMSMISLQEYEYFEWRIEICDLLREKKWETVERMLQKRRIAKCCNVHLQKQFLLLVQAVIAKCFYHNMKKSRKLIEEAICITLPDFCEGVKKRMLLGSQEICALLVWAEMQEDKEKALCVLENIALDLQCMDQDFGEKSNVYPCVAAEYLILLKEKKQYELCLHTSEKMLDMMIDSRHLYRFDTFLEIYIDSAEMLGIQGKIEKKKKYLEAWRELGQDYDYVSDELNLTLFYLDVLQEVELIHEAITLGRKGKGYSQETLCETICEPETISRIENGKRLPQRGTYRALARKLSLPEDYRFTIIDTYDFEVLELKTLLEKSIAKKQWETAQNLILQLEKQLDMKTGRNQQYIRNATYSVENGQSVVSLDKRVKELISILQITKPHIDIATIDISLFDKDRFDKTEISVLIKMSDVLYEQGETEQCIRVLEGILHYYQKSKVNYMLHYRRVILAIARLTSAYTRMKDYERVLYYAEEGIRFSMICKNMGLLGGLLNNKANALQCQGKTEECLKYYRLAFYCGELFGLSVSKIADASYKKITNEDIN